MTTKQTIRTMALLACLLVGWGASAQSVYGDVNGDGVVDIFDVNEVVNAMLGR